MPIFWVLSIYIENFSKWGFIESIKTIMKIPIY